uniref:Zinc finger BED domain-containing protein 5-like n=1 Tax=Phallusia mammillata TaxID=59560 RepID=A0A6F9DYB0_9ASCI|nr:zinc finger BED domain-containing protein 5-like [Phallusia mammillata]
MQSKSALKASYMVAARVARCKKPFTIAEELILSCAIDMCREVLGTSAASKLESILLSNNTITRRIIEMSADIECQLLEGIKSSPYYFIQLDEFTDISNKALLLVFVRYCADGNIHDDLLFCQELPTRTTADEVFRCLDTHFANNSIDWNCVGVCTDGAASMTGVHHGVVKQIQERARQAKWTHCFLHRENLATRQMSPGLHDVMSLAVKTVNYIKKNALHSRCFAALCDRLDSEHLQLLYHSEVRWLSKGRILNRLFELKREVYKFLQHSPLAEHYINNHFCAKLSDLSDIFNPVLD